MSEIKNLNQVKKNKVFEQLREMIIHGYFRPGESLSERQIADMLGVSRTPVREAFRRLENEGIIIYQPKKGVTIPSFSVEQATDLYQVREYLEGLAARLLAGKEKRNEVIDKMRLTIEMAEEAAKDHDIKTQSRINGHFHQLMAKGTENQYLIGALLTLTSHTGLLRSTSLSYQDRAFANLTEHRQICDAIESGDPSQAEQAAAQHVRNSAKTALLKIKKDTQRKGEEFSI